MRHIFLEVVNNALAASYLILAVMLCRLLFRKAPKWISCLLWGLVAIRLVVPFHLESVFSLIPSGETVPADIEYMQAPRLDTGILVVNRVVNPVIEEHFSSAPVSSANPLQIWLAALGVVWLLGIALMLCYALASFLSIKKKVRDSVRLFENVYECDSIRSAFILGVVRPRIYLPAELEEGARECVLAHERTHLQRGDHFWKPFGFLILTIYWFHPLCWIAYVLLCRDIEYACDERATRDMDREKKADYCQALLDLSVQRRMIAACPVAFGEVGVKERVKSVLNYRKPAFWVVAAALAVCVAVGVCFVTNPKEEGKVEDEAFAAEEQELALARAKEQKVMQEAARLQLETEQQALQEEKARLQLETGQQALQEAAQSQLETGQRVSQEAQLQQEVEQIAAQKIIDQMEIQRQQEAIQNEIKQKKAKLAQMMGSQQAQRQEIEAEIARQQAQLLQLQQQQASAEGDSFSVSQNIAKWAEAFCNRDGEAIVAMSSREVQKSFEDRELLTIGADYVSFGFSSPMLTWDGDMLLRDEEGRENTAEIIYYAWTSEPHLSVWTEEISYEISHESSYDVTGGKFMVTKEELSYHDSIAAGFEFDKVYGYGINGSKMDYSVNDMGESLNQNAIRSSGRARDIYQELFAPESAARRLLNLLNNQNKVQIERVDDDSITGVCVRITFAEDGVVRMVRMIQPWGEDGIWIPQDYGSESPLPGSLLVSNPKKISKMPGTTGIGEADFDASGTAGKGEANFDASGIAGTGVALSVTPSAAGAGEASAMDSAETLLEGWLRTDEGWRLFRRRGM